MIEKLEKLIEKSGLSQSAVERKLGLSANRISKWKGGTGEITARDAAEIAKLFNIPVANLIEDDRSIDDISGPIPPADVALLVLAHSLPGGATHALSLLAQAMARPESHGIVVDPKNPPGTDLHKDNSKPPSTHSRTRRGAG